MRFTDWRFIHKAHLNLLPVNAVKFGDSVKSGDPQNKKKLACTICNDKFVGLPHVLCHYRPSLTRITERHNAIVDRLHKASASNWTLLKKNQPLLGSPLRPDLVLAREVDNATVIIDETGRTLLSLLQKIK